MTGEFQIGAPEGPSNGLPSPRSRTGWASGMVS
jgi:hypothetical protein